MKRFFLTFTLICSICFYSSAQNNLCSSSSLFCTGTTQNFPAGVNAGNAQPGPNYGCLYSQPNPAWFHVEVDQPGNIEIELHSSPQHDIDFVCWGPFYDPISPCVAQLTAGPNTPNHTVPGPSPDYPSQNMVDCSYSASWEEWCYIPNATVGQYYIIMITNYSNQPCNIIFSQTGGSGSLSCTSVLSPLAGLADSISICSNPATLTASPGYQHYLWSTGDTTQSISVTTSGIYSITATINGLPISDSVYVTLTQPYLSLNLGNDTLICGNASVAINAGSGFTQYLWNTGSTNQSITVHNTGVYNVQAKDTGNCIYNDSKNVIINPSQSLNIGHDTSICNYSPLTLDAGIAFDTYLWSTGQNTQTISVNTSGTYYITATNTLCAATAYDSISLQFNAKPNANAGPDPGICSGAVVTLYGTGGTSYLWSPSTNLSCTSCASPNASPTTTTTYTLSVTNNAGCSATDQVTVNVSNATVSSTNCTCGLNNGTATVHHTGGSGNYSYVWNTSPAQHTQTAINLAAGNYSVSITDITQNCSIIKSVTINQTPFQLVVYTNYIDNASCGANDGSIYADVVIGDGPFSYIWNSTPPQTSPMLVNVPAGYYCLTVTDAYNCQATLCDSVRVESYTPPEICMVTVDTASNYNMVVWEKPITTGINKYLIFRESSVSGIYNLVGTRNYNEMSTFIDSTSNSLQQPYRYELAIQDNCGFTSFQGNYHQTIHLTINAGMGGSWNLLWNNYEGFSFPTYNIYRGLNSGSLTLINSVSNSVNSYTDLTPPPGVVFYMVEAVSPSICNPSAKTPGSYGSTISNLAQSENIGIDENNDNGILKIYPNPCNDILNISVSGQDYKNITIEVMNLLGQIILHQNIHHKITKLDISSLSKGIYLLKMTNANQTETKKFVKE